MSLDTATGRLSGLSITTADRRSWTHRLARSSDGGAAAPLQAALALAGAAGAAVCVEALAWLLAAVQLDGAAWLLAWVLGGAAGASVCVFALATVALPDRISSYGGVAGASLGGALLAAVCDEFLSSGACMFCLLSSAAGVAGMALTSRPVKAA